MYQEHNPFNSNESTCFPGYSQETGGCKTRKWQSFNLIESMLTVHTQQEAKYSRLSWSESWSGTIGLGATF